MRTLKTLKFPQGKKSKSVAPPTCNFSDVDYVRGLIDGDGSVGFASSGHPIISLVTASEHISKYYIKFLFENIGVEKVINRNKRDGVYNITVGREDAVNLSKILYYNGSMTMDRKLNAANKIKDWVRLQTLKSAEDIGRRKKKKVA